MSLRALVVWLTVAALAVLLVLIVLQLLRVLREVKRLLGRLEAFAELPLLAALDKAERDVRRLEAALAAIEPLLARVLVALAIIRKGPFPPELITAGRRIFTGIVALRTLTRHH